MSHWNDENLPADLSEVADQLRANRPEASAVELDAIKLRAKGRASRRAPALGSRQGKGLVLRSKAITLVLALGVMTTGGTAGVIAHHKSDHNPPGQAADSQYRPGKGCGDKNHVHEREDECKKPPR